MNFDSDSEKTICGRVTYTVSTFVPRNSGVNTESEPDGSRKSGKKHSEYKCRCYVNICRRPSSICCKPFLYTTMVHFQEISTRIKGWFSY